MSMTGIRTAVAAAVLAGAAAAGGGCASASHVVRGTALYRERIALPPGALLEVTLEDVSRADAASVTIGRVRMENPGGPPFDFEIAYDPARIDERNSYAVRAQITVDDRLLFATDEAYPVLTRGGGTEVELRLKNVSRSPWSPAVGLADTYWKLTRLRGEAVHATDGPREPHLILNSDGTLSGSGGCNRLTGRWQEADETIAFQGMAMTRMACPEGMEQEVEFAAAIDGSIGWRITGEELDLVDAEGEPIANFRAIAED